MAGPDFSKIMQQAQQVQKNIQEAQARITQLLVGGQAGGGLVKITMTGAHIVKTVNIDDSLIVLEEKETLEDLLIAAFNDASRKIEGKSREQMMGLMKGVDLPEGMANPFTGEGGEGEGGTRN
jgi:DNA-binding YbaB/EbfC family protein